MEKWRRKLIRFLFFTVFLTLVSIPQVSAFTLTDDKNAIELGYYYSFFEDTERSHNLQDVFSGTASSLFKRHGSESRILDIPKLFSG